MTTTQQRRLYFPAWTAAARNHGWHRVATPFRPVPFFGTPDLNTLYQRICTIAHERATPPTPDDFRHACHIVAFGKDISSSQLTNAQLDKILALFKLLADPEDLSATMAFLNPEEQSRKRLLWFLKNKCVESYVVQVCRERFATDNWEALDYPDLRQLHMTLKNRTNSRKPSGGSGRAATTRARSASAFVNVARNTEPENDNVPF